MELRLPFLKRIEEIKTYPKKYTFKYGTKSSKFLFQKVCTVIFGIYQQVCGYFEIFSGGIVDECVWLPPDKHKRTASGSGN